MNIFVTSPCPKKSAAYLDDKRVVKMTLETAQILSTAIWLSGGVGPYKFTHKNHPCCQWAKETRLNYLWLLEHFKALLNEYNNRYKKIHTCSKHIETLSNCSNFIKIGELKLWPNCTQFKNSKENIHLLYKKTLENKWLKDKRKPTWYKGNIQNEKET